MLPPYLGKLSGKDAPQTTNWRRLCALQLVIAPILALWLLCTIAQLEKYLPTILAAAAAAIGCAGLLLLGFLFRRFYLLHRDVPRGSLAVPVVLLALSFFVLYPLSQKHAAHRGSDREDALRVELVALVHHTYPYDARTFLGNRPTPLPGAMLLAAPFFLLGHVAWQNVFWLVPFSVTLALLTRRRATGLLFLIVFLLTALENLNDFDVGGDYFTNIMYVVVALFVFERVNRTPHALWKRACGVALLGIALSSRIPYLLVVPPLFALTTQRRGVATAVKLLGAVLAVFTLVTLPVFLPHPLQRFGAQMSQNADKLQHLPPYIPAATLPVVAIGIACISFFVQMTLVRVYLFTGLTSFFLIGPPMAMTVRAEGGLSRRLTPDLEYFALPAIFISLWLSFRLENLMLDKFSPGETDWKLAP